MKVLAIFGAIFAVVVGVYLFAVSSRMPVDSTPVVTEESEQESENTPTGQPTFSWSYTSFTDDEIPSSTISLTATYPGGSVETKDIDTIAGDCNDYEPRDADVYDQSTMIICYYAGLGHYYKVVQVEGGYAVQRKVFEEASPDYNPPPQQFETIVQF